MSYNNNKNRIEERVYSVTMTEDELRLFSEFLEQKEFENKSKERFGDFAETTGPMTDGELERYQEFLKERGASEEEIGKTDEQNTYWGLSNLSKEYENKNMPVEAQVSLGKIRTSPTFYPVTLSKDERRGYLHKIQDGKHRMSEKFVIEKNKDAEKILDTQRDLRFKHDLAKSNSKNAKGLYQEDLNNDDRYHDWNDADLKEALSKNSVDDHWEGAEWDGISSGRDRLNKIADDSKDIINKESDLAKSKYDDKYSSKRIEKFLDKKIDADKAKNIVDRRHKKDTDYLAKDTEKGRNRDNFHISDLGRKWNDTGIVYNEALGRNLNKDAAIAAGVTAGLVGGGIALKKHLKKKKQEKELAENKYKTSDDKKKKK